LLVGDYCIRKLVLYEKDFGWMAFWELDPEVLGLLWLVGFCDLGGGGGGNTFAVCRQDWGRQAMPLLNYTVPFALQLRKGMEILSQGGQVIRLLALTWLSFEGQPQLAC
jgi:hypothetical protein